MAEIYDHNGIIDSFRIGFITGCRLRVLLGEASITEHIASEPVTVSDTATTLDIDFWNGVAAGICGNWTWKNDSSEPEQITHVIEQNGERLSVYNANIVRNGYILEVR